MITVVVPARNAARTIGACIQALKNQDYGSGSFEIIVVDDGSDDDTARLARKAGACVITQEHGGAAVARNTGIWQGSGDLVCFTDADCEPLSNWLTEISAPFADPEVAGCKGTYVTRQRELVARFVQLEYEDKYDLLKQQQAIDFIDTYSAAYRRDVLLANGGFDGRMQFLEDQELSFRLAARGYRMVFQPGAAVFHHHASTIRVYACKKFEIGRWKSQIVRRFPDRAVRDSHTPQVLKIQMLLMAVLLLSALLTVILPRAWPVLSITVAIFLVTTLPFVRKAWPKDRGVAIAAPALLGLRALALGIGYGWGMLNPKTGIASQETTIGGLNFVGKRATDIIGSLIGLSLTLLVSPLIVVAIRLSSPGPILFRQQRVGQGGRTFTMLKFRSMRPDVKQGTSALLDRVQDEPASLKIDDDPRVTPVGRFLRRWSLDELPQFWNVLRGDMSLVGPRPEEPRFVTLYNDWHRRRLSVKPGMTGPMQIHGRADLSLDERVALELSYIDDYSVWRDLVVIAGTVPAVITGKGAR